MEFRETSWYDERVYELLRRYNVALWLHDMQGSTSGRMVVEYDGRYPTIGSRVAEWFAASASEGLGGHAPRDAVRLRQRIFERLSPPVTIAADADTGAPYTHAGDRRFSTGVRTARR